MTGTSLSRTSTTAIAHLIILALWLAAMVSLPVQPTEARGHGFSGEAVTAAQPASSETVDEVKKERVREDYGKLPLMFERNDGQAEKRVAYVSRSGLHAFLTREKRVPVCAETGQIKHSHMNSIRHRRPL